jgi:hypothetical protein
MKTILVLLAALIILFTSCSSNKNLSREQLTSTIQSNDKVGIIQLIIAEDQNSKGSAIIGRNSYFYTKPDTSAKATSADKPKKKKKEDQILVMDTLMRMVESKYATYLGTTLVPAPVENKLPNIGLDAGIPCLPKQTVNQAIKKNDLDKPITINVAWQKSGGSAIMGISAGKIKPKAIITTKVYDRSGKQIWMRRQVYDSALQIKNRGVSFGGLSMSGQDGMSGNQLLDMMSKAFDTLFIEGTPVASK